MFKEKINDTRLTPDMCRTRSGRTQLFRKDYGDREFTSRDNADVILEHELPEMYAELIDGEWYWVKECAKCEDAMNYGKVFSYQWCEKHNVCVDCGVHRRDLKETPWGVSIGAFRCKPCQEKQDKGTLEKAMEKRKDMNDWDFKYATTVLCPHCGSDNGTDEFEDGVFECCVCIKDFSLALNYSVTYSTTKC